MNIDWQMLLNLGVFALALVPFLYIIFGQDDE